jgi:ADP-ribose pyrophosphatase
LEEKMSRSIEREHRIRSPFAAKENAVSKAESFSDNTENANEGIIVSDHTNRETLQGMNIQVVSSVPRFIGRVFSVEVQDVVLPDSRKSFREIVRHPGGSSVVALDADNRILLVRQHRVGCDGLMREIPAGRLDPPEDSLTCARRELKEEGGVVADRWDLLTRFYPSPGYSDEVISIYLARDLIHGKASPDEGEWLTCEWTPFHEALQQVYDGTLCDGKTCLGILLAADLLDLR